MVKLYYLIILYWCKVDATMEQKMTSALFRERERGGGQQKQYSENGIDFLFAYAQNMYVYAGVGW